MDIEAVRARVEQVRAFKAIGAVRARVEQVRAFQAEDWARYSDKQVQGILKELEEWDKFAAKYGKLVFFKPNPIQANFFSCPGKPKLPRIRLFISGNRCLGRNTTLEGHQQTIGEMYADNLIPQVKAYNTETGRVIHAMSSTPFVKGYGTIYKVTLCDGKWFEASASHQVMTSVGGEFREICTLRPGAAVYHPRSIGDNGLSTRVLDDPHWLRKVQDSQFDCHLFAYCGDEQPHTGVEIDLGALPLQGYVQAHSLSAYASVGGRLYNEGRNRPCQSCDLLSIQDGLHHLSGRVSEMLSRCEGSSKKQTCLSRQEELQRLYALVHQSQSKNEPVQDRKCDFCEAYKDGSCRSSSKWVIGIVPLRKDSIFDVTVKDYHTYLSAGIVHHNSGKSHAGVLEAISFAHGERLWDGTKLPVKVPNRGRIIASSYLDGIKKVIEPKLKELIPVEMLKGGSWEKGSKIGQQGSIIEVRFANGSWFDLMSTEQESMKFEGADLDWVLLDEPPPRDHWIATMRGLVDRGGFAWFTLTPLSEPWIKTDLYDKATTDPDYAVAEGSTYDNVGFGLTLERVEFFKASLSADEIEARIYGKFLMLQGMVYKEYKDQYYPNGHLVKPFDIPAAWPRFVGIDPHDRTPTHVLWLTVDENGDVYVYDELAVGEKTIKEIAQAIKDQEFKQEEPGTRILRIIDPSAARISNVAEQGFNIGEEFKRNGIYCYPGNNDIVAGHKRVRDYLRFEETIRGKRPRVFIFDSCRGFRRALLNYIYDDRNIKGAAKDYRDPKENRLREKDKHWPDAFRYVMMWGGGPTYIHTKEGREGRREYQASNEVTGY